MAGKKSNLSKISDNSLSELSCLIGRIEYLVSRDFLHVEEFLPKSLTNQIEKVRKDINTEFEAREED